MEKNKTLPKHDMVTINAQTPDVVLEILDETTSTNDYVKAHSENMPEGYTVIARRQTAGKGRMGRRFVSPESGIYMSILLFPKDDPLNITTMAAAAVAKAIEHVCAIQTGIKWVNDIFIDGKKVCGILTEGIFGTDGKIKKAVLGIGINLYLPKNGYGDVPVAGAILKEPKNGCADDLVRTFFDYFFEFYKHRVEYIEEYRKRSILNGKKITYTLNDTLHSAIVEGIDDKCGLEVNENGKKFTLRTGEVHINSYEI